MDVARAYSVAIVQLFMDVLAESLEDVPHSVSRHPATFLADDVNLRAYASDGLQLLLDICTD